MKRILLSIVAICIASTFNSVLSETIIPKRKKEDPGKNNQDRPQAPSRIQLLCTLDDGVLTIESRTPEIAFVEIADESGAMVAAETLALNPADQIDISYLVPATYTLYISIGDDVYSAEFHI